MDIEPISDIHIYIYSIIMIMYDNVLYSIGNMNSLNVVDRLCEISFQTNRVASGPIT